jgi:hypothetical protein
MNTRPAILILKASALPPGLLDPILWGIEEEGLPFEIREAWNAPAMELAKQAANGSALNVGIAWSDSGEIVLHHRDLPEGAPLFTLSAETAPRGELRRLGTNAARLVKRQPLALRETPRRTGGNGGVSSARDPMEELVSLILRQVLKEHGTNRERENR